jgi:hypothetical protein
MAVSGRTTNAKSEIRRTVDTKKKAAEPEGSAAAIVEFVDSPFGRPRIS